MQQNFYEHISTSQLLALLVQAVGAPTLHGAGLCWLGDHVPFGPQGILPLVRGYPRS